MRVSTSALPIRRWCWKPPAPNFSLSALNARGEVLIAFLGDVLREPCVVIFENAARRGSPATSSAAQRRSRKTSAPAAPA